MIYYSILIYQFSNYMIILSMQMFFQIFVYVAREISNYSACIGRQLT